MCLHCIYKFELIFGPVVKAQIFSVIPPNLETIASKQACFNTYFHKKNDTRYHLACMHWHIPHRYRVHGKQDCFFKGLFTRTVILTASDAAVASDTVKIIVKITVTVKITIQR
jgi:hypothetical protein